jgi:hypothetical protein
VKKAIWGRERFETAHLDFEQLDDAWKRITGRDLETDKIDRQSIYFDGGDWFGWYVPAVDHTFTICCDGDYIYKGNIL